MDRKDEEIRFAEWAQTRPPKVAEVALKYPAYKCFKSTENPLFHYRIGVYGENPATGDVTVTLIHGRDSTLPGVKTFGQPPEQLIDCDCGKWEWPTEDQIEETRKRIEAYAASLREGSDG